MSKKKLLIVRDTGLPCRALDTARLLDTGKHKCLSEEGMWNASVTGFRLTSVATSPSLATAIAITGTYDGRFMVVVPMNKRSKIMGDRIFPGTVDMGLCIRRGT